MALNKHINYFHFFAIYCSPLKSTTFYSSLQVSSFVFAFLLFCRCLWKGILVMLLLKCFIHCHCLFLASYFTGVCQLLCISSALRKLNPFSHPNLLSIRLKNICSVCRFLEIHCSQSSLLRHHVTHIRAFIRTEVWPWCDVSHHTSGTMLGLKCICSARAILYLYHNDLYCISGTTICTVSVSQWSVA